MKLTSLFIALALTLCSAVGVHAETNWPRFQGVYLQLKSGDLIQLNNLEDHPGRNYHGFPTSVLNTLPSVKVAEIEAITMHGNLGFFPHKTAKHIALLTLDMVESLAVGSMPWL